VLPYLKASRLRTIAEMEYALLAGCLVVACTGCASSKVEFICNELSSTRYPRTPAENVVFVQPASYTLNQWIGCELQELAGIRMAWYPVDGDKDNIPEELITRCKKKAANLGGDAAVLFMTVGGFDPSDSAGIRGRYQATASVRVVRYVERDCRPIMAYYDYCSSPNGAYVNRSYEIIDNLGSFSKTYLDSTNADRYEGFGVAFDKLCNAFADSGRASGGDAIIIRLCPEETSAVAIRYTD